MSAVLAVAAAAKSTPDNPQATPSSGEKEGKQVVKEVVASLRETGVTRSQAQKVAALVKGPLQRSMGEIRARSNKRIFRAAVRRAYSMLGIKIAPLEGKEQLVENTPIEEVKVKPDLAPEEEKVVFEQPKVTEEKTTFTSVLKEAVVEVKAELLSPELLAEEVVIVIAEEANPEVRLDNQTIKRWAVIITDRVKEVAPQTKVEQVEKVLKSALQFDEEAGPAQIAVQRLSVDHPQRVREIFSQERNELLLQELEINLGIDLSSDPQFEGLPDFLVAAQIRASLYQLQVSKEQIPQEVLTFLQEDLGEQESYSYQNVVEILSSRFTSEQGEAILPQFEVGEGGQERLTIRGAVELIQTGEVKGVGKLSQLNSWYERLSEGNKQKLGWLKNVLDQKSKIMSAVENNPIHKLKQRFFQARAKVLTPVLDWGVRVLSGGRFTTMSGAKVAFANWFVQTKLGGAVQAGIRGVATKVASWAAKEATKKAIGSTAAKLVASGASFVLGLSSAGLITLVQVAVMVAAKAIKKFAELGRKTLDTLGINSAELEAKAKETFGFLGTLVVKGALVVVGVTLGLVAESGKKIGQLIALVVGGTILGIAAIALIAGGVIGSSQRLSMRGGSYSSAEIGNVVDIDNIAGLDQSQLPIMIEKALDGCGISSVSKSNFSKVEGCLSTAGIPEYTIKVFEDSVNAFPDLPYLQCVYFVIGTVPDFPGGGDAYTFYAHPPSGWHNVDNETARVGDLAVWGPSASCQGTCDIDISCCGHIGVVTAIRESPLGEEGEDFLIITQANGANGKVVTTEVAISAPTTILARD